MRKVIKVILMKLLNVYPNKIMRCSNLEYLISKGLKIGENCNIQNGSIIDENHCWLIEVGDNVTIAPEVYLLAHDASTKRGLGYTKIGNVIIGNNCFIGARSIIMPNVKLGTDCIVGAGSVVTKSFEAGSLIAGNPGVKIGEVQHYIEKNRIILGECKKNGRVFNGNYTCEQGITDSMKEEMNKILYCGSGFIE